MMTKTIDKLSTILEQELIDDFETKRQEMRREARRQIQKAQDIYKHNYDKKRKKDVTYKEGYLVAIKRTQFVTGRKLANPFLGPYEVVKVKRCGRYDVKKADFEGPNTPTTRVDNIKLWRFVAANEDFLSRC
ncbi:hypothetical protein KR032_007494, partial [Drosophila birchii]